MKFLFQTFFLFIALFLFCFAVNLAQQKYEKSKPTLEKSKITIKVKEGIGPFEEQIGRVSFSIKSLDQKAEKFEVNKLKERFIHKPIPKNSGLPDLSRIYQIEFPASYNPVLVAREFSQDPNIEYAEPIPINYLSEIPDDPFYNQQWYLHKIKADLAWDIHKGEDGDSVIILSITDTGCQYDHPDIGANIWNNLGEDFDGDGKTFEWSGTAWVFDFDDINNIDDDGNGFIDDLIGWNFTNSNMYPMDTEGHGTWVSGFANATTNNNLGVASISYNLELMPVKGLNYNSIIYAAENGADVINCSWGGTSYSQANKEAIEYVDGLGSIVVAAAHNYNNSVPVYPASYPYVISVAALDSQDTKTPYTNYGPCIDVSAPGPQSTQPMISLGLGNNYAMTTLGTSFSSPIVTGLIGLIKSYHPTWSRDELVKQLLYTTDDINSLNPGYENLLGTGRINAYNALANTNITITPELKVNMNLISSTIVGDTKILSPNSIMNFSIRVQNCSHFLDANPLTITLTSTNPDVLIIDGDYTGIISANSVEELPDEFQIQIAQGAATDIATLTFTASANLPVVAGSVFEIHLIINPSGTLVWEGVENGQDYSGAYINNYLTSHSYPILYTTLPILSYNGLDAIFLSFGNFGPSGTTNTVFDDYHAAQVSDHLVNGGRVYLEGGDALGWDQSSNAYLRSLLGIQIVNDGSSNIINSLEGQNDALTQGMLFTASTQVNNDWIDIFTPNAIGTASFFESGYGNVAVQSIGTYGQKTFCFSYALGELVDDAPPSTRDTLLQRILDFFELEPLQLPSAPLLFTPPNNSILDSSSTIFIWHSSQPQVTKYWFELDTTDQFTTPIIDSTITDTTHLFSGLENNKTYWWRIKACNAAGWGDFSEVWKFTTNIVSVENERIPIQYSLQQNYPNPFNPSTTIRYDIPERCKVAIKLFDVVGNEIMMLVEGEKLAGSYQVEFSALELPSGVYFYQLKAGDFIETKKMILMK